MKPLLRIFALVLAVALVAAACGGDDDGTDTDDSVDETTTTVAGDEPTTPVAGDEPATTVAGDETGDAGDELDEAALEELLGEEPADDREPITDGVVEEGDMVVLHYTGTLDDGEEFDTSIGREPFEFVVGSGQVIVGFDDGVLGMAVGETKTLHMEPDDAYGQPDPGNVVEFPIDEVPEEYREEGIEVVMGNGQPATVLEVTEETVTVDVNHPLAGEALNFDIEIVEIRR